jgi:hypothetical protein
MQQDHDGRSRLVRLLAGPTEAGAWQALARAADRSLSAWIRDLCNGQVRLAEERKCAMKISGTKKGAKDAAETIASATMGAESQRDLIGGLRQHRKAMDKKWIVGTWGADVLSKWIGGPVWTHGNTLKKGGRLTPMADAWMNTFIRGYEDAMKRAIEAEMRTPSLKDGRLTKAGSERIARIKRAQHASA